MWEVARGRASGVKECYLPKFFGILYYVIRNGKRVLGHLAIKTARQNLFAACTAPTCAATGGASAVGERWSLDGVRSHDARWILTAKVSVR